MDAETPRTKPFYLSENCESCGTTLVLVDQKPPIWYDEWRCTNTQCEHSDGVFMDWPPEQVENSLFKSEEYVPLSEVIDDLPFESVEEFKKAFGIPDDVEVGIAVDDSEFIPPKNRGDC